MTSTTLKQTRELELFGAPPTAPGADADNETRMKYNTELMKRSGTALLMPRESDLLLVIGDHFCAH